MKNDKSIKNRSLCEAKCEMAVSPDDKEPTFRKGESVRPDVLKTATEIFDQHEGLMKRLEDL